MGLINSLFGKKSARDVEEGKELPWIPLTSLSQLDLVEEKSFGKPQVIFKHSTTCGISRMVMNLFSKNYDFSCDRLDLYFLDLHQYRDVSNKIGSKFQVQHQSPQLLVIREGRVVAHESHGAITELELEQYL